MCSAPQDVVLEALCAPLPSFFSPVQALHELEQAYKKATGSGRPCDVPDEEDAGSLLSVDVNGLLVHAGTICSEKRILMQGAAVMDMLRRAGGKEARNLCTLDLWTLVGSQSGFCCCGWLCACVRASASLCEQRKGALRPRAWPSPKVVFAGAEQ
jgi:hypothetical protein